MPRQAKKQSNRKIFVLDTNVLLHDSSSLFRFKEHDVFIPFVTLEELDKFKTGTQDINRNARQAVRTIGSLVESAGDIAKGFSLNEASDNAATGRLILQTQEYGTPGGFSEKVNDNRFLNVVRHLETIPEWSNVVLVSKDINLRIKARVLGQTAEDYLNDHALEDADLLRTGVQYAPFGWFEQALQDPRAQCTKSGSHTYYRLPAPDEGVILPNTMLIADEQQFMVTSVVDGLVGLKSLTNYQCEKRAVWGVKAKNEEQNFALNLLLDDDIDFVTLLGPAGTGKTLLTLAAALEQVVEGKKFDEIIFTRATIPMGDDIGFLPGTEEEKMLPWLGALEDNLETLINTNGQVNWEKQVTKELVKSKIQVKAMTFMRGRTFNRKFLIVDEAQNLTPRQVKALVTRAGPGTKVVCMGNLAQIDTPYLTEHSSGLSFAVERFAGWEHFGHIILQRGERSRLANYANEHL